MIKLWVSVSNQAYVFLNCVLGGMIVAFVYDIFRVRRKAIKSSNLIVYFEDFIYWIIVALILFAIIYRSNEGELRGYLMLGVAIGIILYALLLSRIVMAVFLFVIKTVYKVAVAVFGILLIPIRIILKILGIPVKKACKIVTRGARKIKGAGRRKLSKIKVSGRIFNNIRKKI
ncbi:spore cortex biosynthesis protein YabQ [Acetivibrio thermocellus]|uniref:spore cortex biosynthesis protein YabQ n=2 Tax=Acetivibrio thermocellus TaxID=1515 RepID=UPI00211F2B81|nr:spore cortex biosynthesis protein YabQ [Acetivibrio thermocellus]UWV47177.1 spore cortex biosynthesis protein YabQ [Acetivibrio thermocellus]HOP92351.1 spore cortex biosynthesis protein YabQ [Acetivibrio thermocellus]